VQWVLANALGGVIGWSVGVNLANTVGPPGLFTANTIVLSVTLGATIGFAQWLVLRQWLRADLWILASAISWFVGWPVSRPMSYLVAFLPAIPSWLFLPMSFVVGGTALGTLMGLSQWFILKNRVYGASLWLPANVVGYALGQVLACIGLLVSVGVSLPESLSGGMYVLILETVSGVSSGGVLKRLLQQPKRTR